MEYAVHEFERRAKKKRRRRRIAVVRDSSSPLWYPTTPEYSSRVLTDGGVRESLQCLNLRLIDLSWLN